MKKENEENLVFCLFVNSEIKAIFKTKKAAQQVERLFTQIESTEIKEMEVIL